MKKAGLVLGMVLILVGLLFTRVAAIDMNLINSIRQNEQNTAVNLDEGQNASHTSNQILSNFTTEDPLDSPLAGNTSTFNDFAPSSNVSTVMPSDTAVEQGLGINGVINIILIVVGVLIILLGIAILIRTK